MKNSFYMNTSASVHDNYKIFVSHHNIHSQYITLTASETLMLYVRAFLFVNYITTHFQINCSHIYHGNMNKNTQRSYWKSTHSSLISHSLMSGNQPSATPDPVIFLNLLCICVFALKIRFKLDKQAVCDLNLWNTAHNSWKQILIRRYV